jgi:hypothetical protein
VLAGNPILRGIAFRGLWAYGWRVGWRVALFVVFVGSVAAVPAFAQGGAVRGGAAPSGGAATHRAAAALPPLSPADWSGTYSYRRRKYVLGVGERVERSTMTLSQSGTQVSGSFRGGRIQGTVYVASDSLIGDRLTARLIFPGSLRGEMTVHLTLNGAGFAGDFYYVGDHHPPRSWSGTCIGGACLKNRQETIAFKAVADGRGICVNVTATSCDVQPAPFLHITASGFGHARALTRNALFPPISQQLGALQLTSCSSDTALAGCVAKGTDGSPPDLKGPLGGVSGSDSYLPNYQATLTPASGDPQTLAQGRTVETNFGIGTGITFTRRCYAGRLWLIQATGGGDVVLLECTIPGIAFYWKTDPTGLASATVTITQTR